MPLPSASLAVSPADYAGEMGGHAAPDLNPLALKELWMAVVYQAFKDALFDNNPKVRMKEKKGTNNKPDPLSDTRDSIRWLLSWSDDFLEACSHAGLNARLVRDAAIKQLGPLVITYRTKGEDNLRREDKKGRIIGQAYMDTAKLIEEGCK